MSMQNTGKISKSTYIKYILIWFLYFDIVKIFKAIHFVKQNVKKKLSLGFAFNFDFVKMYESKAKIPATFCLQNAVAGL